MNLQRLHAEIEAVCPIDGVRGDRSFDPAAGATVEEIAAGEAAAASYVDTPEADAAWLTGRAVMEAAGLLQSPDPIPQAVRVLERVQQDWSNEQFRRIAVAMTALGYTGDLPEPLTESDMFAMIAQYMQNGLSLPGERPDA